MSYGELKIDTITFTSAGVDTSVSVSGLVQNPTFTGNITTTGTISGDIIRGNEISGVTITGDTGNFTSGIFSTGTAAAPSIVFDGDPDTGFFSSLISGTTSQHVSYALSGVEVLRLTSDIGDNRIQFNNFSARVSEQVLIEDTGSTVVTIVGNNANGAAEGGAYLGLARAGSNSLNSYTALLSGNVLGKIQFRAANGVGNLYAGASIEARADRNTGNSSTPGNLAFFTTASGSVTPTERMHINCSGNVGLGTSSPDALLHLSKALNDGETIFRIQPTSFSAGFSVNQAFTRGSTDLVRLTVTTDAGNADKGSLTISTSSTTSTTNPVATFTGDGRVGIGTTSPDTTLEVQNSTDPKIRIGDGTRHFEVHGGSATQNTGIGTDYNSGFNFFVNGENNVAATIDSSRRLLVNTDASISNVYVGGLAYQSPFQVIGNAAGYGNGLTQLNYSSAGYPSVISLGNSKNATVGQNTAVASGDDLGILNFVGNDGTNFRSGAYIIATCDSTVASGDVPTRLAFYTKESGVAGPLQRMQINSTGLVSIGSTPDPYGKLSIYGSATGVGTTEGGASLQLYETSTGNNARLRIRQETAQVIYDATYSGGGNAHRFYIGGSHAVSINSSGQLLIATTTASSNINNLTLRASGNAQLGSVATIGRSGGDYDGIGYNFGFTGTSNTYNYVVTDTAAFIKFGSGGGRVETFTAASGTGGTSISFTTGPYVAQGGTSWTSSSDERLKEDLSPIENGLTKVNSLRAVTGRFKTDDLSKRRSFLIAQDVQEVLPEAVDTFDPESLGLDYVAVIPLLVAALKESKQRIEILEQRLTDAGIA